MWAVGNGQALVAEVVFGAVAEDDHVAMLSMLFEGIPDAFFLTQAVDKGEVAKQTDFRNISDKEIRRVQNELNHRPRKTLGYETPSVLFLNLFQPLIPECCTSNLNQRAFNNRFLLMNTLIT